MANILEEIASYARLRVAEAKEQVSLGELREQVEDVLRAESVLSSAAASGATLGVSSGAHLGDMPRVVPSFFDALARPGMSVICECKKASPSKGIIAKDFPYVSIAKDYERAGAAAVSCLTEPKWFLGSLTYLQEIAAHVDVPVLRKDFIVDEYQIYEARLANAAAVLLIVSLLDDVTLERFLALTHELGIEALVEVHDAEELQRAEQAGARVMGVNNRNLKDFTVDVTNSLRLREFANPNSIFVAESGIKTAEDVAVLARNGVDAILVGETLMRAPDKAAALKELTRLV